MHGEETGTKAWEAWEAYANVLARPVDLPSSPYLTHLSSVSTFIHSHGAIHASATRLCPGLLNYRGCVHLCVRMIAAVIRRAKVEIVTIDRILSKLCVFEQAEARWLRPSDDLCRKREQAVYWCVGVCCWVPWVAYYQIKRAICAVQ